MKGLGKAGHVLVKDFSGTEAGCPWGDLDSPDSGFLTPSTHGASPRQPWQTHEQKGRWQKKGEGMGSLVGRLWK